MKVLQVHNTYRHRGGEDTVAIQERVVLERAGFEVGSIAVGNPSNPVRAASGLALAIWNPVSFRQVARAIQRHRPDVVHVHNTWFQLSPSVIWAIARAGVPIVWTAHNFRVVCGNGILYRDEAQCYDCVGAGPWPGVRHRCYRDSYALSAISGATIAAHERLGTWRKLPKRIVAVTLQQRRLNSSWIALRSHCREIELRGRSGCAATAAVVEQSCALRGQIELRKRGGRTSQRVESRITVDARTSPGGSNAGDAIGSVARVRTTSGRTFTSRNIGSDAEVPPADISFQKHRRAAYDTA
jgi:hypothetical protein